VRLSGVVTDKDGGLVPGATVVVTSVDTGEKRPPQITNAAGAYSFPGVAPGKYHVTISLPGFKTTEIDATVTAGSSNALSTKLEVGAVSEVVYVQAGTELVRSNPPTVTQSVSTAFSQTLSRSDRNTANYLVLLPGGGVEFGPPPAPTATPQAATAAQAGGAGAGTARVVGGAQRGAQESSTPQRGVVRWRVDAAGQVSKSVDAGRTWTRIALDRVSNIVSGAAPSDSVCWLIGRAGLVLLSVDGSTFKPVAAPASADLRTITAVDARQATVTTVAGVVYATSDGGVTWKRPDGLQ
jgi:hypothetical protein